MSKAYIDREAALNKLRQMRDDYRSRYNGAEAAAIAEYCRDALIDIPTADVVEVRHERWIGVRLGDMRCSLCGEVYNVCVVVCLEITTTAPTAERRWTEV